MPCTQSGARHPAQAGVPGAGQGGGRKSHPCCACTPQPATDCTNTVAAGCCCCHIIRPQLRPGAAAPAAAAVLQMGLLVSPCQAAVRGPRAASSRLSAARDKHRAQVQAPRLRAPAAAASITLGAVSLRSSKAADQNRSLRGRRCAASPPPSVPAALACLPVVLLTAGCGDWLSWLPGPSWCP